MSNQKYYTDGGSNQVWLPSMASIWHVRDNNVLHDYADTRVTEADYGTGLLQALSGSGPTTLTSGDKVIVGPGRFQADQLVCAVDNVELIFYGTVIEGITASTIDNVIEITGDNVILRGMNVVIGSSMTDYAAGIEWTGTDGLLEDCHVDGGHVTNAGAGNGILVNFGADRHRTKNCSAKFMNAGTSLAGRGFYNAGARECDLNGFYSEDNKYIGMRFSNIDHQTISNVRLINMGKTNGSAPNSRSIEVDGGTGPTKFLSMSNIYCYTEPSATNSRAYIGINHNYSASKMRVLNMSNVRIINDDNISSGVSFNTSNREQCMKAQNIEELTIRDSSFVHGDNSGSGNAVSVSFDATPDFPQHVLFEGCGFSGSFFNMSADRVESMTFRNCSHGIDHIDGNVLFQGLGGGQVTVDRCKVNLRDGLRMFTISSATPAATDFLQVSNCEIFGDDDSNDLYIAQNEGNEDLLDTPRRVYCYGNTYVNNGTQDLLPSDDSDLYLLLTTDRNGDMLYDSSDGNMPAPGAGPTHYFTGVPGILGQKIINIRWAGSGVQYYVYDGTGWRDGVT